MKTELEAYRQSNVAEDKRHREVMRAELELHRQNGIANDKRFRAVILEGRTLLLDAWWAECGPANISVPDMINSFKDHAAGDDVGTLLQKFLKTKGGIQQKKSNEDTGYEEWWWVFSPDL